MSTIELSKLQDWCQDAVTLLPTPELPASITEMRREAIRISVDSSALYEIAMDLAEGLNDLPEKERIAAQATLSSKHGIGFDFFIEIKRRGIRDILKRGFIRNEREYRKMLDLVSDTTIGTEVRVLVSSILAKYESG